MYHVETAAKMNFYESLRTDETGTSFPEKCTAVVPACAARKSAQSVEKLELLASGESRVSFSARVADSIEQKSHYAEVR